MKVQCLFIFSEEMCPFSVEDILEFNNSISN